MSGWDSIIRNHVANQISRGAQPIHGVVTSVDPVSHAVKVTMQPDNVESGWIPDATIAAANLKICCPSEIGTQVLVVPVEGDAEHPVVVARLFDTTCRPPISPVTNRPVQAGEIGIFTGDNLILHISKGVINIRGTVKIDGDVVVMGDVSAGNVSLQSHAHRGVRAGQDISGPPEGPT